MVNAGKLLNDLKTILRRLIDDIRDRCDQMECINKHLQNEYNEAKKADRTAQTYLSWQDEVITQTAAAWILACVFVRFMEDNRLIENSYISGHGEHLHQARDNYTLYFRSHPRETDREYLLHIFKNVSNFPGVKELFNEDHNRLWRVGPTGDGASLLINFFQKINAETGELIHDFTDPTWDTRFLGDLYQDLSEEARKKYALLQTPEFVEEFILDRTLTPAIATFGLKEVLLIDPACGSGHFLIGAFYRLLRLWQQQEPETNERELVQRSLDAVYGVDINPQATAIARFRLLLAAMKASHIQELKNAPGYTIHIATGDSLLHGPRPGKAWIRQMHVDKDPIVYVYETEDADKLRRYLGQHYHAVVGNPPYITVKDKVINQAYRNRFGSCYKLYSLVCPFLERFFDLAVGDNNGGPPGFVGAIVANSFMKREFGKKLVETFIPKWDLTHVIDTSGVYLPGHGTPTVILFGRNQKPIADKIRTVMGIKGEPGTQENAADGAVWKAVVRQINLPGSESEFVSAGDTDRKRFHKHPWSLGGGGAIEILNYLNGQCKNLFSDLIFSFGFGCITKQNDVFLQKINVFLRNNISLSNLKWFCIGEDIRDWSRKTNLYAIFPYTEKITVLNENDFPKCINFMWPYRTNLFDRKIFGGKTYREAGKVWYEYGQIPFDRYKIKQAIPYAFIATHNHFLFNDRNSLFGQSAPIVTLLSQYAPNIHYELLGLLNSSTGLFWGRQTLFSKRGDPVGRWGEFVEWDGTKLLEFPIPEKKPLTLAQKLDELGTQIVKYLPTSFIKTQTPTQDNIEYMKTRFIETREQMIALQEELDWQCYNFYQITNEELWMPEIAYVPRIKIGERAFEIIMARKITDGALETRWFERHGSTPVTEIPGNWPEDYRRLVQRRIELIESDKDIRLIEQPEYKRRWAMEPWKKQLKTALEQWLLNRLEFTLSGRDLMTETAPQPSTKDPRLISCVQLADLLRADNDFLQVAELYKERPDFDVTSLVEALVENEAVPFLSVLRYKPSGLRKRKDWEETWKLQREEDAIDALTAISKDDPKYLTLNEAKKLKKEKIGDIPVPPKYQPTDFTKTSYWKSRGKLDVPKERFILYPGLERQTDGSLVITWAGWDHLQQAQALSGYLEEAKNSGWNELRLIPMLAGLFELLPWLLQWHNDMDPAYGACMGDFFANYIESQARELGNTLEDLRGWAPET